MRLFKNNDNPINDDKIINVLKGLSIDMINEYGHGYSGINLSCAPIMYTLFANHLKFDPTKPNYYNRDRLVISGKETPLLYATMFLSGFEIELDDLKKYQTINSKFPMYPDVSTIGVEATTGLPGSTLATATGMSIGEAHINSETKDLVSFNTYVILNDDELMEGASYEAASLAGNLKLNKLIVIYNSTDYTADGETKKINSENIRERFESMGWHTTLVNDVNNFSLLNKALEDAKKSDKPSLIEVKTILGESSEKERNKEIYNGILTKEEVTNLKTKLNIRDIPFTVTNDVMEDMQYLINKRIDGLVDDFNNKLSKVDNEKKEFIDSLILSNKRVSSNGLDFDFKDMDKSMLDISSEILNGYYSNTKLLFGGSANCFSTSKGYIKDQDDFTKDNRKASNINFGNRELSMGYILNGLCLVGLRGYGITNLIYSDYMKAAIRSSAIMKLPVIYMFTDDNFTGGLGKMMSPVEQLATLRHIPNLDVFRPADVNELVGSYKAIMQKEESPAALLLPNTTLPILSDTSIGGVAHGGYIVEKEKLHLDGILISSGEELHQAIKVSKELFTKGIDIRVVSMPNIGRFLNQDKKYIDEVLPVEKRKIVLEFSNSSSWNKIIFNDKNILGINEYISCGNKEDLLKEKKFDTDSLISKIEDLLK